MNPYEEQEPPEVWVRCIVCNERVEAGWFDLHIAEECDAHPSMLWEPIDPSEAFL